MKVVFLDIDGVINTADITKFRQGRLDEYVYGVFAGKDYFDHRCVGNLNKLLKLTGAKIVVSSSWRLLFDIETLSDFFIHQNIQGQIIGYTDRFGGERGHEIQEWLNRHPEVDGFVILDDDSDMANLHSHHVKTTWERGLEEEHIVKAIEIINRDLG